MMTHFKGKITEMVYTAELLIPTEIKTHIRLHCN